jgi:hypothetical protein
MQTFCPSPNLLTNFWYLDSRRLGKQRVEAFQILNVLLNRTDRKGWRNHPAVLMWKGYENALKYYYNLCLAEWINRGYNNNMLYEKIDKDFNPNKDMPPWFGDDRFHSAHRSNLLRKNKEYYSKFGWKEEDNQPYFWPSKEKDYIRD